MPLTSRTMSSGIGNDVRCQYSFSCATSSFEGLAKRSAEDGLLTRSAAPQRDASPRKPTRRLRAGEIMRKRKRGRIFLLEEVAGAKRADRITGAASRCPCDSRAGKNRCEVEG